MNITLYLVRHGETEGGETRRYKGSIDVPMSEKGIGQMRKVADFIKSRVKGQGEPEDAYELIAVYSSPLSRAIKSAEIIAEPLGVNPVIVQDLRERHFGIWEGMSFDEIREQHPEEFNAWANNPLTHSPIQGESTIQVRNRVVGALNSILDDSDSKPQNRNIIIASHGGVNRIMLCHLIGIPLENIFRVEQDYGAVNIIEFWDGYPVVKLLNYRPEGV